jgi:hypothetical protein
MKHLLAPVLLTLAALPAQAADWDIPRAQFEIPTQLAQAAPTQLAHATTTRHHTSQRAYDEALSLPRGRESYAQSQRRQASRVATTPTSGTPAQSTRIDPAVYAANPTADPRIGRIYVAGALSGVFADDADARSTNALANAVLRSLDVEAEFDTGYGALGALGWRVLPAEELGPRFEVEVVYHQNDFDTFTSTLGNLSVNGDMSVLSLMVNAAFDL